MSSNEQFERACNYLEGHGCNQNKRYPNIIVIDINPGEPPHIKTETNLLNFPDIHDEEMDVARWRQFGKYITTCTAIKALALRTIHGAFQDITPEAAHCLRSCFDEIKENKTVENFHLYIDLCTAIPALDLRYFFQNNHMLSSVIIITHRDSVSRAQSTHLSAALRNMSFNYLRIICNGFTNNGAFQQVLLACQKMKKIDLNRLSRNNQFSSIAEWLRDPMTLLPELALTCESGPNPNLDVERAENEILSSLTQNVNLRSFRIVSYLNEVCPFRSYGSNERIKHVLCNTASIGSIIQSNHSLQSITIHGEKDEYQQYLEINKNPNKKKVVQTKIVQFHFSDKFDASSIANMPLSVLAHVIGIDVQKKQSAIFNILKSVPELCAFSSRAEGWVQS